ncbi:hypothetical protein [Legionella cardiaca]|uniref:Substrate of the Dot/Icm secretion system n=1 Tax=Legionella cardiaca TaxID=1071983 RepID=A0ABY8APQ6_9GAMM|nr:hypothetical protein [Legionella cardiaca]WED42508.1 hypothetical protein PXX05_11360 [Legionella cardiaca]
MHTLAEFETAEDKIAFLLDPTVDVRFYAQLVKPNLKQEKARIIKEILDAESPDFPKLIIKLTDLSFSHSSTFIRTSDDFLKELLFEFFKKEDLKLLESKRFAQLYEDNPGILPSSEQYQLSKDAQRIFTLVRNVAVQKGFQEENPAYQQTLGSNIVFNIFISLIREQYIEKLAANYDAKNPDPVLLKQVQQATKELNDIIKQPHSEQLSDTYFNSHLTTVFDTTPVDDYYKDKKNMHEQAIANITKLIKTSEWDVAKIGFFRVGGLNYTFEGKALRLPHRVTEMAKLITAYNNLESPTDKDLYKLYKDIQAHANDALENPRPGQKESTRNFYHRVLDNLYFTEQELDQKPSETASLIQ